MDEIEQGREVVAWLKNEQEQAGVIEYIPEPLAGRLVAYISYRETQVSQLKLENAALRGTAQHAIQQLMGCAGWSSDCAEYHCEGYRYCQALQGGDK